MDNYKIFALELIAISRCIDDYTDEPNITTWRKAMHKALDEGDYDVLVYSCKKILEWYEESLPDIRTSVFVENKQAHQENIIKLEQILDDMNNHPKKYQLMLKSKQIGGVTKYGLNDLLNLLDRFHQVVVQLRSRHDERETIDVSDEYDVQDLLHALLRIFYDDVRAEEWTPSYAGGSKRQDFLLKTQKTVIEVKKTRKGLGAKEVGEQLLVDIGSYKAHPDCKTLICFVYDVENRINNPRGFEHDLSKITDGVDVRVLIRPQL